MSCCGPGRLAGGFSGPGPVRPDSCCRRQRPGGTVIVTDVAVITQIIIQVVVVIMPVIRVVINALRLADPGPHHWHHYHHRRDHFALLAPGPGSGMLSFDLIQVHSRVVLCDPKALSSGMEVLKVYKQKRKSKRM